VDGQARSRRVDVAADIDKGVVTISLDRSFLPDNHGPSYGGQTSEINFGLLHWAEQVAPFHRVIHLYDGKPAEYYFPESRPQTMRLERQGRSGGGKAERLTRERVRERIGWVGQQAAMTEQRLVSQKKRALSSLCKN